MDRSRARLCLFLSVNIITELLKEKKDAVYHKCKRLGLQAEEGAKGFYASSSIKLAKELLRVEETLRLRAGAGHSDRSIAAPRALAALGSADVCVQEAP